MRVLLIITILFSLVGCLPKSSDDSRSKKTSTDPIVTGGGSGVTGDPGGSGDTSSNYFFSDGKCYVASTRTEVAASSCVSSPSYYSNGATCYNNATNAVSDIYYCPAIVIENYFMSDGSCYAESTGEVTNILNCDEDGPSYYSYNGQCYDSETGYFVDKSFCPGIPTEYLYFNGTCYEEGTSTPVDMTRCVDQTKTCSGTYYYQYNNNWHWINCTHVDCSGEILVDDDQKVTQCE